jgi:signal transduction histidine kinase
LAQSEEINILSDKQKLKIITPSVILRITREVISNIIKHAQATQVHISILSDHDQLSIEIKDNGLGFVVNDQTGKGLKTIKKRAKSIVAEVKWRSALNSGTTFILKYRHGNE